MPPSLTRLTWNLCFPVTLCVSSASALIKYLSQMMQKCMPSPGSRGSGSLFLIFSTFSGLSISRISSTSFVRRLVFAMRLTWRWFVLFFLRVAPPIFDCEKRFHPDSNRGYGIQSPMC
ncbi:Hypothetical protein GL50581_2877 [Giardia duodenalis ATCC 50581]|uniref:Uncharacterized protein n=1 Tax=Giardia intestinalis (strain ATCC 50581 / GS clone H7) TaxID=598745 RepID=C6LVR9_GIAIB|nr:Hypothetical protein GL50581_2877 [Giardia intestinalis ATCC 50581]